MVSKRFSFILIVCLSFSLALTAVVWAENPPTMVLKWGVSGTNDGQFKQPHCITTDASGYIYVADTNNNRIQKFDSSGTFIAKLGTLGTANGQFTGPYGIAVDGTGNIYVSDTGNNRIQKFNGLGVYVTSWGGYGSDDGHFSLPSGIAVDSSSNVYVADTYNHRIQKFTSDGILIAKWGALGTADNQLDSPLGLTSDASGNIWVADTGNNRILKFDNTGNFIAKWGSIGTGNGFFKSPAAIAFDALGNVYVTDKDNNRVQKFSGSGTFLSVWGGYGSTDGLFIQPWGVALDNSGNIYVADRDNNRIQKFGTPLTRIIGLSGNMAFGNVNVGTIAQRTLTISNTGNSLMTVYSVSYPSGFSGNWSGTIAPGAYQNVTVTFMPSYAQSYSGALIVNSDKTSGTETLSLSGIGVAIQNTRIISLNGDMSFGNVNVGTNLQRTLTINNTGNSAMTVSSISYPSGFSGNWSGVIAAGSYQNVTVTFTPSYAQNYSGNLIVNSDKTSGVETLAISGIGFISQNTRIISLSGDTAFGNVNVGITAQRTLTISNTGNSPLTVSSIASPSGFSCNWSGTIAAGSYQSVVVNFTPTYAQTYSGTLMVNSDKTSGTDSISLSGTGIPVQGSISVIRNLSCYLAGTKLTVYLNIKPSSSVLVYAVEEKQPAGWIVSNISDYGVYDSSNGKIKFGPFFDNYERTLTYDLTPPTGESGEKTFSGTASANGVNTVIGGNTIISTCFNHPADISPKDFTMSIGEVTAYGQAWINGTSWTIPPNPIDISYLTRAGLLWQSGEKYKFDSTAGEAPMCWVNTMTTKDSRSSESSAVRQIPESYLRDNELTITIDVSPSSDVKAYAVEDQPPDGWEVVSVNDGGRFDSINQKVKFGLFLDNKQRSLTYAVRASSADIAGFAGIASFNGKKVSIMTKRGGATPPDPGDINCDTHKDLQDVILILQVLSGLSPTLCNPSEVINNDQKLGIEDAIYLLQFVSGIRQ